MEVAAPGLPEQTLSGSLFGEGSEAVEVRAGPLCTRAVGEEPREEVRKLDEEMEAARDALAANQRSLQTLAARSAYLDRLESGFVVPAYRQDLGRGVLDAAALEKGEPVHARTAQGRGRRADCPGEEGQRTGQNPDPVGGEEGEAHGGDEQGDPRMPIFCRETRRGGRLRAAGLPGEHCGWSPAYVFRTGKDANAVAVECNALIQQMSGEDWSGVSLSLSTASPALAAGGPGLAPFAVNLSREPSQWARTDLDIAGVVQSIHQNKVEAIGQQQQAVGFGENVRAGWALNTSANDLQGLELANRKDLWGGLQVEKSPIGEEPSLSYQLAAPVSLASRGGTRWSASWRRPSRANSITWPRRC